jgi:hypothetical protein
MVDFQELGRDISEHFSQSEHVERIESIKTIEGEGMYSMLRITLLLPFKDVDYLAEKLQEEFPSLDFLDREFGRQDGAYIITYYEK